MPDDKRILTVKEIPSPPSGSMVEDRILTLDEIPSPPSGSMVEDRILTLDEIPSPDVALKKKEYEEKKSGLSGSVAIPSSFGETLETPSKSVFTGIPSDVTRETPPKFLVRGIFSKRLTQAQIVGKSVTKSWEDLPESRMTTEEKKRRKAYELSLAGDFNTSNQVLNTIEDDRDAYIYELMAYNKMRQGNLKEAQQDIQTAINRNPNNLRLYPELARIAAKNYEKSKLGRERMKDMRSLTLDEIPSPDMEQIKEAKSFASVALQAADKYIYETGGVAGGDEETANNLSYVYALKGDEKESDYWSLAARQIKEMRERRNEAETLGALLDFILATNPITAPVGGALESIDQVFNRVDPIREVLLGDKSASDMFKDISFPKAMRSALGLGFSALGYTPTLFAFNLALQPDMMYNNGQISQILFAPVTTIMGIDKEKLSDLEALGWDIADLAVFGAVLGGAHKGIDKINARQWNKRWEIYKKHANGEPLSGAEVKEVAEALEETPPEVIEKGIDIIKDQKQAKTDAENLARYQRQTEEPTYRVNNELLRSPDEVIAKINELRSKGVSDENINVDIQNDVTGAEKVYQAMRAEVKDTGGELPERIEPPISEPAIEERPVGEEGGWISPVSGLTVRRDGNVLRVFDKEGIEIPQKTQKEGKKSVYNKKYREAVNEYIDQATIDNGIETEIPEGIPLDEYITFLAENSKNPKEIYDAYISERRDNPSIPADSKEEAIARGIGKVFRSSFIRFGDRNRITMSIAKGWFAKKGERGQTIDQVAMGASADWADNPDVTDVITPQDVINFMEKYPNMREFEKSKRNPNLAMLKNAFKELTGFDIERYEHRKSLPKAEKIVLSDEEMTYAEQIPEWLADEVVESGFTRENAEEWNKISKNLPIPEEELYGYEESIIGDEAVQTTRGEIQPKETKEGVLEGAAKDELAKAEERTIQVTEDEQKKLSTSISREQKTLEEEYDSDLLYGLKQQARKHDSFEEFSRAYSLEGQHGIYWHVTDNPEFKISKEISPRDMSTMAGEEGGEKGALMLTTDLPRWDEHYNYKVDTDGLTTDVRDVKRGYAVQVDLSDVDPSKIKQTARGFGNEIYLSPEDAAKAKVVRILPIDDALKLDAKYSEVKPQSERKLRKLWGDEQKKIKEETGYAKETGTEVKATGTEEGIEGEAGERLRVRDASEERMEAPKTKQEKIELRQKEIDKEIDDLLSQFKELSKKPGRTKQLGFGGLDKKQEMILVKLAGKYIEKGVLDIAKLADVIYQNVKDVVKGITAKDIEKVILADQDVVGAVSKPIREIEQRILDGVEERGHYQAVQRQGDIAQEVKEGLSNSQSARYYVPKKSDVSRQEAKAIVEAKGLTAARSMVNDLTNGMHPAVRTKLRIAIGRAYSDLGKKYIKLDKDKATKYFNESNEVFKEGMIKGTELAQGLEAYKELTDPERVVFEINREFERAMNAKLRQYDRPIKDKLRELSDQNEEVVNEWMDNPPSEVDKAVKKAIQESEGERFTPSAESPEQPAPRRRVARERIEKERTHRENLFKDFNKGDLFVSTVGGLSPKAIEFIGNLTASYIREGYWRAVDIANKIVKEFKDRFGVDVSTDEVLKQIYETHPEEEFHRMAEIVAAERLAGRIVNRLKKKKSKPVDPIKEMVDTLFSKITEITKGQKQADKRTPLEKISAAILDKEKYAKVWEEAKDTVVKKIDKLRIPKEQKEAMLAELDAYMDEIIGKPVSAKQVRGAIRGAMTGMRTRIYDLIREHYTVQDAFERNLVEVLVEEAGLTGEAAKELARVVQAEMRRMTTEAKMKALSRLSSIRERAENTPKKIRNAHTRLIELSNLGAFSDEKFLKAYGEKMGFPELTPEQMDKLYDLGQKVQDAPEGTPKYRALQDLLVYQNKLMKGLDWGLVAESIFYADMLSRYTTQERNILSNIKNTLTFALNSMIYDPFAAPFIATSLITGHAKGVRLAWDVLKTGYAPIKGKLVDIPPTMDQWKFKGGRFNPLNYVKYVTRFMYAMDAFSYAADNELRSYEMAKQIANKRGIKAFDLRKGKLFNYKELWREVDEILHNTKEDYETAKLQAEQEGLKGNTKLMRIYELMSLMRDEAILNEANEFASRGTFNHPTEGMLGLLTDWLSYGLNAAQIAVPIPFTQKKLTVRPLKSFIPFTRIISNVANRNLDFFPLTGFYRAAKGGIGSKSIEKTRFGNKYRKYTKEERIKQTINAVMGTAALASLWMLTERDKEGKSAIEITADGTGDPGRNKLLREQLKWQPFSIRIGDRWYSYQYSPFFIALAPLGFVRDQQRYNRDKWEDTELLNRMGMALWEALRVSVDMTAFGGLGDLMTGLTNKKQSAFEKFMDDAGRAAEGALKPGFYTQLAQLYQELFHLPMKENKSLQARLIRDIPIARNSLNNYLNVFGEPVYPHNEVFITDIKDVSPEAKYMVDHDLWVEKPDQRSSGLTLMEFAKVGEEEKLIGIRPYTDDEFYQFMELRGKKIKEGFTWLVEKDPKIVKNCSEALDKRGLKGEAKEKALKLLLSYKREQNRNLIVEQANGDAQRKLFGRLNFKGDKRLANIGIILNTDVEKQEVDAAIKDSGEE